MFTLILFTVGSYSIAAQSLQEIYSNLDKATSLSVTQNSIYIVEQGKNRLLKLDHSGKLLETIGGKGSGDYQFSKPVDVDATNGLKIFVTDYNNRRVQVFDRRGQFLSSLKAQNTFGFSAHYQPRHIVVNNLGEVFLVDDNRNRILHFDLDYNLIGEFRIPSEIKSVNELRVHPSEILILDKDITAIHRLSLNGSYRGFYLAEGVETFYVSGNKVYKFSADGLSWDDQRLSFPQKFSKKINDAVVIEDKVFILLESELVLFRLSD